MKKRLGIALLFGGRSAEHEISIQSARNIFSALDKGKYRVIPIAISQNGDWLRMEDSAEDWPKQIVSASPARRLGLAPGSGARTLFGLSGRRSPGAIDVIFPVLHGTFGEDGTVQGLFKLMNIPFVGAGVLGSAVGMDKDVMKRLLKEAGIPIARFLVWDRAREDGVDFGSAAERLGSPLFVKPANLGSSVGIHKVRDRREFEAAAKDAFRYDTKILIEEYIQGREIECSVLGNERPIASLPGEIIPRHEFYSYEAKYLDDDGARLAIPARLPEPIAARVQDLALRTFQALCCEGMARVDFFLRGDEELLVNEINTIPGFTRISMYPKLWEASGLSYPKLLDRLIQLALERFKKEKKLKTSYS